MNILVTSAGKRNYLAKYFKDSLKDNGQVHISNYSPIDPALLHVDRSVVTPGIFEEGYVDFLMEYCIRNRIGAIISQFDLDLPVLSRNKGSFGNMGVNVIVSDNAAIDICCDKWKTYHFLIKNGLNAPKTFLSKSRAIEAVERGEVNFPLIVKPRWGFGSIGIIEASNNNELKKSFKEVKKCIYNSYLKLAVGHETKDIMVIQEKLSGHEYGLDIINNMEGQHKSTIVKRKYSMRSGETYCAETVDCTELQSLGEVVGENMRHVANMDVDIIYSKGKFFILDLNARFGGGYPFSHFAGVDLPLAILKWLKREKVEHNLLVGETGVLSHKNIMMNGIEEDYVLEGYDE